MKSIIFLAFSSIALAQTITQQKTVTQLATVTSELSAQETCISACAPTDVTCQAICVGVPHPGAAQMNGVTDCVASCDQGDGSASATDAYAACRNGCISSYIVLSGTAAPVASSTGSSGPISASPSASAASGSNGTFSASGSPSSSSSMGLAAPTGASRVGAVGGSLGLVFAAFALL